MRLALENPYGAEQSHITRSKPQKATDTHG